MARTKETKQQTGSGEAPAAGQTAGLGEATSAISAPGATPAATAGGEAAATPPEPAARAARRVQVKVGRVVSNKMQKTVIVTVENTTTHRLYHRYMKKTSKFAAHDAESRCKVGDTVEIVSSRPLSKSKRWRVREVLKRAQ